MPSVEITSAPAGYLEGAHLSYRLDALTLNNYDAIQ